MHTDLKLRFRVRVGLVYEIALPAARSGTRVSAPPLVADNSSSLASNNRLYRCKSLAFTTDALNTA